MHSDIEHLRQLKLKEKNDFGNMIQSLNREEEMRQRLRKESMINNRSQLEN